MPEVLQQMLNYVIAIYIRLSAEAVSYTHLTLPTQLEV